MKKVFLFISVLMFAVMANATILDIAPNSPKSSDNVRREIRDHINPGDTLRLADGTYSESEVILLQQKVLIRLLHSTIIAKLHQAQKLNLSE